MKIFVFIEIMKLNILEISIIIFTILNIHTAQHAHFSTGWTPGFGVGRRSAERTTLDDKIISKCSIKNQTLRKIMAAIFVSIKFVTCKFYVFKFVFKSNSHLCIDLLWKHQLHQPCLSLTGSLVIKTDKIWSVDFLFELQYDCKESLTGVKEYICLQLRALNVFQNMITNITGSICSLRECYCLCMFSHITSKTKYPKTFGAKSPKIGIVSKIWMTKFWCQKCQKVT